MIMSRRGKTTLTPSKTWISEIRKSPMVVDMVAGAQKDVSGSVEAKAKAHQTIKGEWWFTGGKNSQAPIWGPVGKLWPRTPWLREKMQPWIRAAAENAGLKPWSGRG